MKRAGKTKCLPSGAARHFMSCHKCFGLMLLRCVDPWRRQTSLIVDLASLRLPLPYLERRQAGAGNVRLGARQIACSTEIGAQHVLSAAVGKSGGPFELMFRKCHFSDVSHQFIQRPCCMLVSSQRERILFSVMDAPRFQRLRFSQHCFFGKRK